MLALRGCRVIKTHFANCRMRPEAANADRTAIGHFDDDSDAAFEDEMHAVGVVALPGNALAGRHVVPCAVRRQLIRRFWLPSAASSQSFSVGVPMSSPRWAATIAFSQFFQRAIEIGRQDDTVIDETAGA